MKRLQSLIPILSVHHAFIHSILDLLSRPTHSLQRSPNSNGPTIADLPGHPNSLGQSGPASTLENTTFPVTTLTPTPTLTLTNSIPLILRHDLNQPIRQPEKVRLGRRHPSTGEDQIAGARQADQRREAVRAPGPRDDTEPGLGQTHGGGRREHAEVRREGELEAAAERERRDGRDGGDREGGERR